MGITSFICTLIVYSIRPDSETLQIGVPKRRCERDIDRIAAAGHENASDARCVEARVEGVPLMIEINFKPRAEIHCGRHRRNANVTEISSAIARRHSHAAAERYRQMREIPAHARAFSKDVE